MTETDKYFGVFYVQFWVWEVQFKHSHLEVWPSDSARKSQQPTDLENSILELNSGCHNSHTIQFLC